MMRFWLVFSLVTVIAAFAFFSGSDNPDEVPGPRYHPSRDVKVEVLNGCGTDGLARIVGNRLRSAGFDVMSLDNADRFDYPESIVIDRLGNPNEADRVAEALGISNRIQQIVPDPFRIESVTVIIGKDYSRIGLDKKISVRNLPTKASTL